MNTLVIMDGLGERKESFGNAIVCQTTPHLDKLKKKYQYTTLQASGESVGLPKGSFGNSEVGHTTIGAGRVVLQSLLNINNEISNKNFERNPALISALKMAKKTGRLHLLGLLSGGGVHSHINHLIEILKIAGAYKIAKIFIHAITDGRDVGARSCFKYIEMLKPYLNENVEIASVCGRFFAMDREENFDRTKEYYDTIINGSNFKNINVFDCINEKYQEEEYDEFFTPIIFDKGAQLQEQDVVIFFNLRPDRARQICFALTDEDFDKFKTKKLNLNFFSMTKYDDNLKKVIPFFNGKKIENNLAKILSDNCKKQFHISETTKYAHVTYFLNGGFEKPYKNEDRKMVESSKALHLENVPQMKAAEITEIVLDAIASTKYDFIVVNLCNCDMIGHTGNFDATKKAVEIVDKCAYAIALATLMVEGECIITADHGNAEIMFDKNGDKVTSHTTSPVPFYLVSNQKRKLKKVKNQSLANIAPTILKMMDIKIPSEMEKPLI